MEGQGRGVGVRGPPLNPKTNHGRKERWRFLFGPASSPFPSLGCHVLGLHNSRKAARADNQRAGVKNREAKS